MRRACFSTFRGLSADKPTTKLVLLRHGESLWNQKNLFTGWCVVVHAVLLLLLLLLPRPPLLTNHHHHHCACT